MKKLQSSDCLKPLGYGIFERLTLQTIISRFVVFLLVLNNLVYQTDFQINQLLLVFLFFAFLLGFVVSYGSVDSYFVFCFLCLAVGYIFTSYLSGSPEALNRSVAYFSFFSLFLLIFFHGHKIHVTKSIFIVFLAVYLCISFAIIYSGNRAFVNPNWVAMTLFYVYFIFAGKSNIFFLLFGLLMSFMVFESRGTSVVFAVSILIFCSQKLVGMRITKGLYTLVYFVLVFGFFFLIHLLSNESQYLVQFISSVTERGLGGRETALIQGYQDLIASNFIGVGLASPGGYVDPVTGKGVHIHFGLLELMLKYSGLVFFLFLFLMIKLVKSSSKDEFPMIGGAMMTVFFYNGLAPSHLGLNVLLLIAISKILWSSSKTSGSHF